MSKIEENLKLFFLGIKEKDGSKEPFLYKNKDLTTHATIIGMTGSGKTGLGITLLEEAAIDNIPSIIIDPKGDMTNMLLAFPEMKESDFLPYIDENEAKNKGMSVSEMASKEASTWKSGIESGFQSLERVKFFKESADFRIYTPKSSVGLGVSLLSDFEAPVGLNSESLNEYILTISSSILSLLGISTEDNSSKESVLLQHIFLTNFSKNQGVTIANLIQQISNPPFDKIGVFDIETFYSSSERLKFAMKLNSLFASPSFSQWCEGERLDISKMLFNESGQARCNIFTISHLNDSERMFFVTLLLNEIIRWMRTTEGTSSLRAILYMDEIFGYFPPTSNPPSKEPMLTLLKQARAFGVGCVLSTQNPVDLDYKGLSNMGTWFIGRLQTQQDKERVISGLTGISGSEYSKSEIMELISNLKKRSFLVKNINEDGLEVISTRWALSYLKGPLNDAQISNLMADKKTDTKPLNLNLENSKPIISPEIKEYFSYGSSLNLRPYLLGSAKVIYKGKDFEYTKELSLKYLLENSSKTLWSEAEIYHPNFSSNLEEGSKFEPLPSYIASAKNLNNEAKELKEYIYRNVKLELFSALDMLSTPGEEKSDFMLRLHDRCNEVFEAESAKFLEKLGREKAKLEDALSKAQTTLEREKSEAKAKGLDAVINIGSAILGTFLGSKKLTKTNATKVATSAKSAGRVLSQKKDVELAEQKVADIEASLEKLIEDEKTKLEELKSIYSIKNIEIKVTEIQAKKVDIFDEKVAILWQS
ncbi:MAG: ATP-binding protein [Campylobacteraceae bacterium]|nr:ATP-binding protein [Campylobacteraceae bacterium]